MNTNELIAAAAKAARKAGTPPTTDSASVYHQSLVHDVRAELSSAGIDDDHLVVSVTLAKAEERAAKLTADGVDLPPALKREIAHLREHI